jgi:hypothetical protein
MIALDQAIELNGGFVGHTPSVSDYSSAGKNSDLDPPEPGVISASRAFIGRTDGPWGGSLGE